MKKYQIVITPHDPHNAWCASRSKGVCQREVEWKVWVVEDDKLILHQATTCDYHLHVATKHGVQCVRAHQRYEQGKLPSLPNYTRSGAGLR